MNASTWSCYYRDTSNTWFPSETQLDSPLYICLPPTAIKEDAEQPKPAAIPNPHQFADAPGSEEGGPTLPPSNPGDSWTRDADGTLVPEGTPYDNGPFASLWRFPARFLDHGTNGTLIKATPFIFWGFVVAVIWKAFRK
jgi:hypothetical protein